jgi:hypothetical protein
LASIALCFAPQLSLAQEASLAPNLDAAGGVAEAAFVQGLRALDERDYAAAEALFDEALASANQDRYRFNLGVALIHQGKFVEAARVLRPLVMNPAGDPLFGEAASELEHQARDRIGTIVVEGRRDEVAAIRIGAERHELREARLGVSVDPGVLELTALDDDGDSVYATLVEVGPGALVTVSLNDAGAPAGALAPDEEEGEASVFETWWFWTAVGGAVLVAALGTWLAVDLASGGPDGNVPPVFVGDSP